MSDIYSGRLECDGEGNLLASEGDRVGEPVRYYEGSFVFCAPGDPSHNEAHEQNAVVMHATQTVDPDLDGYAGTEDSPANGAEHHFHVMSNDPHADGVKKDPNAIAAKVTGHTDAYKGSN